MSSKEDSNLKIVSKIIEVEEMNQRVQATELQCEMEDLKIYAGVLKIGNRNIVVVIFPKDLMVICMNHVDPQEIKSQLIMKNIIFNKFKIISDSRLLEDSSIEHDL
ncbi:hypothetical protein SNEBB_001169 [Seison nebaliae]|nr:hypothetical protein SNEBB_001169 [Seison nebaliae]